MGSTGRSTRSSEAAKAEIAAINGGLKTALEANALAQAGLVGEQKATNEALLKALKSTEFGAGLGDIATYAAQRQDVAIGDSRPDARRAESA